MSECVYCQNTFEMNETCSDEFRMWQGLQGPYYIPSVDDLGNLSWTNTGDLPNPDPVNITGKGLTIVGIVDDVEDLPETANDFDVYLVGEEDPYEGYMWDGSAWVDLGIIGHGPQGEPGEGVPSGGAAGQVLTKVSGTDYDTEWADPTGGGGDPATATPLMDGTAAVGTSEKYAREDHVHPTDTNRASANAILQAAEQTITSSTTGTSAWITLTGLTANHVVGNWGLRTSSARIPENSPPCNIEIETDTNRWRYTLTSNSTAFYLKPTFILKQN